MALSTFVYIQDVDNLSDARYAAGMGVELIGFKLDPSNANSLDPIQFKEISEWISGVTIVGEFGNCNPDQVQKLLGDYAIEYILISNIDQLQEFHQLGKPLILQISVNDKTHNDLDSTLNQCSDYVTYFLVQSDKNELSSNDEKLILSLSSRFPFILGYGVHLNNASSIVDQLKLKGISLKGSTEVRPGYKEFDEMADILETLETE